MPKKGEPKQKKSAPAKVATKKSSAASTRTRKTTPKQAKQKAKKEVHNRTPLPGSFKLTWESFMFIKKFWKPLGGIVLVYTLLNLIFGSGLIGNASSAITNSSKFKDALTSYGALVAGGNSGQTATMQTILLIVESLVIIWALRHLFSGENIKVKNAYYHSMAPLIPFLLVIFVIVLQLLPFTIGSAVLAIVLSTTYGSSFVGAIFTILFVILAAWSIYMVSSSVFAMYIVTLPNMQPLQSLRSAKNLARYRRWQLIRKVLFVPFFIILFMGVLIVPLILWVNFLVVPVFFLLMMLSVLFFHVYLYGLYKGLLA
jgi:hypothetical protein